jgi:hypothetical protein
MVVKDNKASDDTGDAVEELVYILHLNYNEILNLPNP